MRLDHKGFTLIELLIVMAIIAILISIGLAAFTRAQAQARDGQRKSDLQNIAGALESYYSDNNVYPASLGNLTPTYIRVIPENPTTNLPYTDAEIYLMDVARQTYCLHITLDITPNPATTNCPNPIAGSDNFVVSSRD